MAIFRRSLAEDAVDRYNHTWAVMLLLLLSFTTWFLPLSPRIQPQNPASSSSKSSPATPATMLEYRAVCWCPAEFSNSYVMYVQAACGSEFNKAINGIEVDGGVEKSARLYYKGTGPLPMPDNNSTSMQSFQPGKPKGSASKPESEQKENDQVKNKLNFINLTVPFALFVLAVCLKLPHLVWTLLSSFVGLNVAGTLEPLKSSQALDSGSRQRLKQELVNAANEASRATSYTTSLLYLIFKALMVAAALGSLVVVKNELLPQAQDLGKAGEKDLDSTISYDMPTVNYTGEPLVCEFSITRLQAQQTWMVQCVFSPSASGSASVTPGSQMSQSDKGGHLGMYEALFTVLMVFFLVLTVVNILSLLIWSSKLILRPCRQRVSSNSKLPTDMYLLLFMAQDNVGTLAAADLAQVLAADTDTGKEEEREKLQE